MKITALKSFPIRKSLHLVKVETDDGHFGWGETGPSAWRREMAVHGLLDHFREFLVGKDPRNIGAIWQEMARSCSHGAGAA